MQGDEYKRFLLLLLIMTTVSLIITGITIKILYDTAFEENRARLVETVQSQTRLIEAVARFDATHSQQDHPEGAVAATLSQIIDAHENYEGFGETGEFTLARREGDDIVFVLNSRHIASTAVGSIPFNSTLAEPMRQALLSQSGTIIGLDYRGEMVLAAYEPVAALNLGMVAKIDLSEIRKPFIRAGSMTGIIAIFVIMVGALLFLRISNPLIEQLRMSEEKLKSTLSSMDDLVFVLDKDNLFIDYYQPQEDKRLYVAPEQFLGEPLKTILPPHLVELLDNTIKTVAVTGAVQQIDYFLDIESEKRWFSAKVSMRRDRFGEFAGVTTVVRDITERKQAEEQIKTSLREKEILLKEIHHRVKNNLQVISGLLDLQSSYIEDEQALHAFQESRNRIKSMALIHERLYQTETLAQIDFAEYVNSLVGYLRQMYGTGEANLRFNIAPVFLTIEQAIPCGLITNELVSNAMKHAFPPSTLSLPKGQSESEGSEKHEIYIELQATEGQQLILRVGDNGVGLPLDVDFRRTKSLGMTLVTSLVKQIRGTIKLHREEGTVFEITFRNTRQLKGS
ncbi:histidine kinase dimerization/phosphoacceptor domain -containing protein [Anaerolineales bacterium HSG6]|nr:histidine kinase dimerization/phosphoacceptor domain -containing protein [Anaerolineales bacterium HSG6]